MMSRRAGSMPTYPNSPNQHIREFVNDRDGSLACRNPLNPEFW